ncbi:MAG: DUF2934 domain-containing protein [Deltaproteobacteria bacterium]|nr:DUF2934 domain-containing protein [Deltaproteobacteria bacterium]
MAKTREPTPARSRKTRSATVAPMIVRDETATAETPEDPAERAARERLIAERAYLRAEQRGFAPGGEVEDWLAAEREIDAHATAASS